METGRTVDRKSRDDSVEEYLKLLGEIAEAGLYPEKFADLCHSWAKRPSDSKNLTNFEKLLDVVYKQSAAELKTLKPEYVVNNLFVQDNFSQTSFTIDANLEIVSIGDKAKTILGVSLGDSARSLFAIDLNDAIQAIKATPRERNIKEVFALDGSRHSAFLVQIQLNGLLKNFFRFTLCKLEIADGPRDYIRDNFELTQAEMEILNLVLQRLSIPKIAETRQSTPNTVRTHISRIKRKFQSRSLTDVILSVQEIIAFHDEEVGSGHEGIKKFIPIHRNTTLAKIPATPYQVEYSRYGSPHGAPLVILHSIEYGVSPSKSFVSQMIDAGYCLYIPMRPGFGRSSVSNSIEQSAEILEGFIRTLKLTNITLMAFSTAAPTAIKLLEGTARIARTIFVNYGFHTENKVKHIKPVWLKGLLEFGLGSADSFQFSWRMTKGMLRLLGYKNFYRKLYSGCEEDLDFLNQNTERFKESSNLLQSASPAACRNDLVSAFLPNDSVLNLAGRSQTIIAIFGSHTHGISLEPMRESSEALGIPFHVIENSGRNCIYQRPNEFLKIVKTEERLRETG